MLFLQHYAEKIAPMANKSRRNCTIAGLVRLAMIGE